MQVAAIVAVQVSRFALPYLVAVHGIGQVKGKVSMQIEPITRVEKLIFNQIVVGQGIEQLCVYIGAQSNAALVSVNSAIKAGNAFVNGAFGYLAGGIPCTVHS